METSIYLAKLLGPIFTVIGLGILLNQEYFRSVAKEVIANPALFFLTGVLALLVGGLIVLLHNTWQGWPAFITLFGWVAIVTGVLRALVPAWTKGILSKVVVSENALTATALFVLALGAYLTAMGYWLGPMS